MHDLEITWPEGQRVFSPEDSPIRLGRSSEAAVPLTEGSVSRRHLELVWTGDGWTANDSSTHGTFDPIGVRLAPQWQVADESTIRLGGVEGVEVKIRTRTNGSNGAAPLDPTAPMSMPDASASASFAPAAGQAPKPGDLSRFAPPSGPVSATPDGAESAPSFPPPGGNGIAPSSNGPAPAPSFPPPSVSPPSIEEQIGSAGPQPPRPGPSPILEPPSGPTPPMAQAPEPGADAPAVFDRAGPDSPSFPPPGPDAAPPGPAAFPPPDAGPAPVGDRPVPPPGPAAPPGPESPPGLFAEQGNSGPGGGPPGMTPRPGADGGPPPGLEFEAPRPGAPAPSPEFGFDAPGPGLGQQPSPDASPLTPATTIISDSTLRLHVDGQDYTFLPGTEVTVGRDPSCLVQLDERHSLVSRRHLQIQFRDNAWWMEDYSSKGTFVDNRRLKGQYKAEGAFVANLGDDDAGTPLRIITAGEHRSPSNLNLPLIAALAAVALIPLIALAFLLLRNSNSDPDFAAAKQSTVMLLGQEGGQGTGFFVTDNLILTNQHVAALSPQMLVAVSRDGDAPAQIEYATSLVANHPYLDIAVLQVTNRATIGPDGVEIPSDPVGQVGLPPVKIGDSDSITLGDVVFSTGFPGRLSITSADDMGNLRLPPVSPNSGEASSFTIWPGCSNPDWQTFIPAESPEGVTCSSEGDVENGVLIANFSSGQGASGSAVFRDNEMVAVVFAGAVDEANASLNITSNSFADWLDDVIDGAT